MSTDQTPGAYVEEGQNLPLNIMSVETAIPVFIGYTQKAQQNTPKDLLYKPVRISSLRDYENYFGLPSPETTIRLSIDITQAGKIDVRGEVLDPSSYLMYYSLQLFFNNGGGPCYIISVGGYSARGTISVKSLRNGLRQAASLDDATLLLFPDAINLPSSANYYALYKEALTQAATLKDRFVVMDVWANPADASFNPVQALRDFDFGDATVRKYGAAYYPRIWTNLDYYYHQSGSRVTIISQSDGSLNGTLKALSRKNNACFMAAKAAIANINMLLPVSPAVVGIYANTDNSRGVWKAPANAAINCAVAPEMMVTDKQQEDLNVDVNGGKSINGIRSFPGRGAAVVWGARTLAGNDNEWRYIPVRRFFIMVEISIRKALEPFVFEPNDLNTWRRVRAMIENYLTQLWRAGALLGTTTRDAFFVKVGLGHTMTTEDILQGRMIVEIGMAMVRPAEFILLRFCFQMSAGS